MHRLGRPMDAATVLEPIVPGMKVMADATALFQKIVTGPNWMPFGFIAAEAELARMK